MLLHKSARFDSRVRREAHTLARIGHAVTVVEYTPEGTEESATESGYSLVSVKPPKWIAPLSRLGVHRMAYVTSFVLHILRVKPDVVHAHDAAMLIPGFVGSRLTRSKLVYDSHEFATGVPYRSKVSNLCVTVIERALIGRCDAVLTVSEGIADRLQSRYRLARRPFVVRNFTDLTLSDSARAPVPLRTALEIGDAPLVLHQGAAAPDRGCENLVRAATTLVDCHLIFLGDGEPGFDSSLARLSRALGIEARVHFMPNQPSNRLLSYTAEADVGVSLLEDTCENHRLALPNKVFEYVAAGVPVVVSDLPELAALVREHGIGWTVDSSDPASIAMGLSEVLSRSKDKALDSRLAVAAPKLHWSEEEQRLKGAYHSIDLSM